MVGNAWHSGKQVLGTVDRVANIGMRLLGAAAASGMGGRALESGVKAADMYKSARNKTAGFIGDTEKTVDRFRKAAPELNLY